MVTELDGLTAVVTGGASGIGAAVAMRLHEEGASVAVLDLDCTRLANGLFGVFTDVADDTSVRAAIDTVAARYEGHIDIVVNNVGIGSQGCVMDNDDDEWMRVFNINVLGIVRTSRAALPYLRRSPSAAVINIGSVAATVGIEQRALYSASKGAVVALTRAMAADHLHDGIRVNCVNPGTVDTPWIDRLLEKAPNPSEERAALSARQPHGRLVYPNEVASAVAFLANPNCGSITGVALAVDGGMQNLYIRPDKMSPQMRMV